ncbi:MAG: uroporphyrin-III C-methyltransferase [Pseudomonadota bacterium]|nr:uroporphyrin-III C-methyltransferase [Pseudomonadota bacterium]MDQ5946291.1 uroporphyrin-III C-methyltransferase [Pseudomonadota bacterium]
MSEENSKSVEAAVTVAEAPGAAEPVSPSATQAPPQPAVQPAVAAANAAPTASRSATWQNPWLWVAAGALALSGWQWIETRLRLADTQQELAKRLADSDSASRESRLVAKQSQDQLMALQAKLGALESKLTDSQSQQASLENLYQDLARNRDEWALSEIEQSVTLAAQQLQLAGNVQGAILALQAADARLSGSARPQFISLRKSLGRDLDRLKALPQVDVPSMSLRLENVVAAIDTLPLAVDVRPREESRQDPVVPPEASAWQRLAIEMWHEVRGLVRIQRFDRDEPVLLAPGQVFFLRENIKLRLLNARLALLSRDQWTFRNELKVSQVLMERHFDAQNKSVQTALGSLKQLGASEVAIDLPTLNESLSAIRNFKLARDRDVRDVRDVRDARK